jgi:hypothetical protein
MIGMRLTGNLIERCKSSTDVVVLSFATVTMAGSWVSLETPVRVTLIAWTLYLVADILLQTARRIGKMTT